MSQTKGQIVLVEDDSALAGAMTQAFERAGFQVFSSIKMGEIANYLRQNTVDMMFVDCLLPGTSGVDFIIELRQQPSAADIPVVLMSGLFTDAQFVRDSLRSTQAIAFLKKPFELKEALDLVKPKAKTKTVAGAQGVPVAPRKALYQLFSKNKVSVRDKRRAIEALDEIHGFDLPYLYSLLAETQSSGHLNIVSRKGEVSGISFAQGSIIAVDIVDKETYLGKLLIESGYIHPADLDKALNTVSTKKIGEKLIQGNLLSPHAFQIVLANQMSIRLSRTISDTHFNVNFVSTEVDLTEPNIDSDALSVFLHDWIASKITLPWLKSHYTPWAGSAITQSAYFNADNPILKMPLMLRLENFVENVVKAKSLQEILDSQLYPIDATYKALHLLLAKGLLVFASDYSSVESPAQVKNLNNILSQFQGKNKIEIFQIISQMTSASDADPAAVLTEFKKIIGVPTDESQKVHNDVLKIAQNAVDFILSGQNAKMKEDLDRKNIELKMRATSQFEEAKNFLQKAQYAQAHQLLQKVLAADPNGERIKLYLIWAKLGLGDPQSIKDVEMEIVQIPPEEKFDALYSFVMGLYYKNKGDITAAKKSIEKAINMDNSMIVARRELAILINQSAQKKDVFNRDLKDLVSGFFKKK